MVFDPLNWFTIWHSVTVMSPMSMAKPSSGGSISTRHLADADFADEGMRAAIAALRRIAEREQEALVAARQRLQPHVALGREGAAARA